MNRKSKLLVLISVTVLLSVCAVFVLKADFNTEVPTTDEEFSIFTADTAAVTSITREYGGTMLTFKRSGNSWTFTDDASFIVDTDRIGEMLNAVSNITTAKQITGAEGSEQYGLEDPELTVTIDEGNITRTLNFAGEAALSGNKYLSTGDGNVYLVSSSILDPFKLDLLDMVKKDEIPSLTSLTALEIKNGSGSFKLMKDTFTETDDDGNETVKYTWSVEGENLAVDRSKADALTNYVKGLVWQKCVSYNAGKEELTSYGLDEPSAVISAQYDEGNTFRLYIGNFNGEYYYARTDSDLVYLINTDTAERLMQAVSDDLAVSAAN